MVKNCRHFRLKALCLHFSKITVLLNRTTKFRIHRMPVSFRWVLGSVVDGILLLLYNYNVVSSLSHGLYDL